jgi:hypothetical protein
MSRRLVAIIGCVALMLTAAVSPVAAQPPDPMLTALNGLPGTRLDICAVSGTTKLELASGLRYGRFSQVDPLPPGTWTIQGRVASTGTCRGRILASASAEYEAASHYTTVVWKPRRAIRVRRFENDPQIPAGADASLAVRHVARVGDVNVWLWQQVRIATEHDTPTFELARGASSPVVGLREGQFLIEAFFMSAGRPRQEELWRYADVGYAQQAYLIGTEPANFRLVLARQLVAPVP